MKPLNSFVNAQYSQAISHEYGDRLQGIEPQLITHIYQSLYRHLAMKTYSEYMAFLDNAECDEATYKALIKDGITANQVRLSSILDVFISLNVPTGWDGDVDEIWNEGLLEIQNGECAQDMIEYASFVWSLPATVSEAVYHVLEQLYDD